MSVHTVAVKRAVQILEAIGATYSIKMPDGQKFEKKRRRGKPEHDFAGTGYAEVVKSLKKGESHTFPLNGFPAERFRATIAAKASTTWGKQSSITHINREAGTVEVLRVK